VTYDAIIDFANPDLKLFPGMTAYATIPVASVQDVDKVPNAALRYKPPLPPEDLRALQAKAGVGAGGTVDVKQTGSAAPPRETAVIWKLLPDHTIVPVEIALGLTDHAFTEVSAVMAGSIKPGEQVVTGAIASKAPAGPQPARK
jgi:HlyD family secretion protein